MSVIEINKGGNIIRVHKEMLNDDFVRKLDTYIQFKGTGNRVLIGAGVNFGNSKSSFVFECDDNILYLSTRTKLEDVSIKFQKGKNSVVYLNPASKHAYKGCSIVAGDESIVYFGKNAEINPNGNKHILALEHQNIIVGQDCLFANNIMVRTNDAHLIFDAKTGQRINPSGSVWIGDHVWITRGVQINKNVHIGSGSIIGAGSVAGNRVFPSNVIAAGVPCKTIKKDVFFDKKLTNNFTPEDTDGNLRCEHDEWIYSTDNDTIDMYYIDKLLKEARSSNDKLRIIKKYIEENQSKNRFAIQLT